MSATARIDDLLDLDALLTPEDKELRETVRRFGEQRLRPHIAEWFEAGEVPVRELAADLGKLGILGMHLEGYGCGGSTATAYGLGLPGARGGRQRSAQPGVGAGLAGDVRHPPARQRGAARAVAARDGHRRRHRLFRADRARLRLQPRRHAHHGTARRLRLDPQRFEDVDHQRLGRRRRGRVGPRRGRCARLPGARRDEGIHRHAT